MQSFTLNTGNGTQFVDITRRVQEAVQALRLDRGVVTVFVPHTTAGVTVNENSDPDVMDDVGVGLERAVPWQAGYRHGEGNAAAHVKSSLVGVSLQVLVEEGRMRLGQWQAIYFCEFDGPRTREVWVSA